RTTARQHHAPLARLDAPRPRRSPGRRSELVPVSVDVASAVADASRHRLQAELPGRPWPPGARGASTRHVRAGHPGQPGATVRRPAVVSAMRGGGARSPRHSGRCRPRLQFLPPRQPAGDCAGRLARGSPRPPADGNRARRGVISRRLTTKESLMRSMTALLAGLALAVALAGCSQKTGVAAAADAMGATNLNSIQFSGSGTNYAYGQAYTPGGPWPRFEVKTYTAAVDYKTPAMRLDMLRAQGEHPPKGGGAQPFATDQRTIQVVSGKDAWSEGGAQPAPNRGAETERLRQIWLTPHGVIKAAMASGVAGEGKAFTFKAEGRDVKVTLNDQNLVDRVEYLTTNSVVGDVPVELTYSDYAKFGDIQFPKHIVEKQDGLPTLDIMVSEVQPNAAVSLPVPPNVASAPVPPATPMVTIEKVGDGLWSVNGAGTRSLAVEFADHITMLEGPTSDARSKAANDLVRKTVPNKPITEVVNTHAHYDHAGGLREYVAEGITVITHESNKDFYEKAWARPRT